MINAILSSKNGKYALGHDVLCRGELPLNITSMTNCAVYHVVKSTSK